MRALRGETYLLNEALQNYAGSSSNSSITIATPSSWCGNATDLAYFWASGWPSAIAQDLLVHESIEKSFGLSPNETQSSAVSPNLSAIFASVAPLLTPCAEISNKDSLGLEWVTFTNRQLL